jgi:hypothetical protein
MRPPKLLPALLVGGTTIEPNNLMGVMVPSLALWETTIQNNAYQFILVGGRGWDQRQVAWKAEMNGGTFGRPILYVVQAIVSAHPVGDLGLDNHPLLGLAHTIKKQIVKIIIIAKRYDKLRSAGVLHQRITYVCDNSFIVVVCSGLDILWKFIPQ